MEILNFSTMPPPLAIPAPDVPLHAVSPGRHDFTMQQQVLNRKATTMTFVSGGSEQSDNRDSAVSQTNLEELVPRNFQEYDEGEMLRQAMERSMQEADAQAEYEEQNFVHEQNFEQDEATAAAIASALKQSMNPEEQVIPGTFSGGEPKTCSYNQTGSLNMDTMNTDTTSMPTATQQYQDEELQRAIHASQQEVQQEHTGNSRNSQSELEQVLKLSEEEAKKAARQQALDEKAEILQAIERSRQDM